MHRSKEHRIYSQAWMSILCVHSSLWLQAHELQLGFFVYPMRTLTVALTLVGDVFHNTKKETRVCGIQVLS